MTVLLLHCLHTGRAADWFLRHQCGGGTWSCSGASEARLHLSRYYFRTPRLCGASGPAVCPKTRTNCCRPSSGHYGKQNTQRCLCGGAHVILSHFGSIYFIDYNFSPNPCRILALSCVC